MRLLVAIGAFLAWGCNSQLSTTKHTLDQPTRGTEATMWVEVNDDEYRSNVLRGMGLSRSDFVEADDNVTQRLKFWVENIDRNLRSMHPRKMANVPAPKVRIVKNDAVNAFVAGMPVCYELPMHFEADGQGTADAAFISMADGNLGGFPIQAMGCKVADDAEKINEIVQVFNSRGFDCQLSVDGDQVVASSSCPLNDLQGSGGAQRVVVLQMANYLTVFSGLLKGFDENSVVAVLAHELGHYYRAHSQAAATDYDYFYTMETRNPGQKPTPEPALAAFGQQAMIASAMLGNAEQMPNIADNQMPTELYFAAGTMVVAACQDEGCSQTCQDTLEFMDSDEFVEKMDVFPFKAVTADMRAGYREFITKANACFDTIEVVDDTRVMEGTKLSKDVVLTVTERPIWPTWTRMVTGSTRQMLAGMNRMTAARLGPIVEMAEGDSSLKDVIAGAAAGFAAQEQASVATLEQARVQKLGYYTIEQEADDLAAEWLTETGIDPRAAIEGHRLLGHGRPERLGGTELSMETCEELMSRNWKDENGDYVHVPIGDYAEIHHSQCFRMFNLAREIEAHDFEVTSDRPQPPGDEWGALQRQVRREMRPTGGFNPEDVSPFFSQYSLVKGCAFTQGL